jgi:hypothetical protein
MKQLNLDPWIGLGEILAIRHQPFIGKSSERVKTIPTFDGSPIKRLEKDHCSSVIEQLKERKFASSYWLNIDKLAQTITLHAGYCRYIEIARNSGKWKGFGSLTEWGGWLEFGTAKEAMNYFNQEWKVRQFTLSVGCNCLKP